MAILTLYRILTVIGSPVLWLYLALRFALGLDSHIRNRLGLATSPKTAPVIWLHAASIGELQSVKPLLIHLNTQYPRHQLLVTTNNPTALELARGWKDLPLTLQAAPLDTIGAMARFLDHWQPQAFINIEGELWPNRLTMLAKRHVPTVFINARLSDRSANRLARFGLGKPMLHAVLAFYCQDNASTQNFAKLGVPNTRIEQIPNLKSLNAEDTDHPDHAQLAQVFTREKTILAASTHKGEDEVILAAFAQVLASTPDAQLILAPRHPKRGNEMANLIKAAGFRQKRRSTMQEPDATTQVYLADTLGEMALFYQLAAITFVAGSLVPKRGHTPYEPVQYQSAIITGPHVENFAEAYGKLTTGNGCLMVRDGNTLANAITALMEDETRATQIYNATNALQITINPSELFDRMLAPLALNPGGNGDE